ncbi:MAG: Membrane alanyl aminopeptidase Metallo peptidase family [Marmoricola sp.]|nr:Membrane alanyl aminopeptidase Metallo peptidase family [Marmoricola sp.]
MRSLQREEAQARSELLDVTSYDVTLDLRDEETFASLTAIKLVSRGGTTFLDLKARSVQSVTLDDAELPLGAWDGGRYPLVLPAGEHLLEVRATMSFRNDGEGLHRSVDPADGRAYVYQMSFMSAAPSVFACFDQPDLKAPYTLHVTAPADWNVTANAAGTRIDSEQWEFATTEPLSTYVVSLVAGPYHRIDDHHDGIDLGLLCRPSMAAALDADADELMTTTRQCFDEYHRLFGVRYAFGKYDQAFVPEFNAGAMENPGCVTFREGLLFTTRVPRSARVQRATTVAHEMAHQWFGNLVTPVWWDDLWLNEAFAEYMGNRVAAEVTEFSEALVWASLARRNWGLTADARPSTHPVAGNGAPDADAALQDFDGISYSKGHAVLTQLADQVGDAVFLDGVREHFALHRFGNATMQDLFSCWERAGAGDLGSWTQAWLRTAGLDAIDLDRAAGVLVRTPPPGPVVDRTHALGTATWDGSVWTRDTVLVTADETPINVPADAAVVLDPNVTAWASLTLDATTAELLVDELPQIDDDLLRASIWNTARNGVHHALLDPRTAVDLLCAGIPTEEQDAALSVLGVWVGDDGDGSRGTVHEKLLPVLGDAEAARARLHTAFLTRAGSAAPGSDLQLAGLHGAVTTASDPGWLTDLVAAPPPGIDVDAGLRWRVLRRLATLGALDLEDLDRELAVENDAKTQVSHAWCRSRLPTPEAKEWAWARFTGAEPASNYEIEAIGTGFWHAGRDALLAPYVERYFADLPGTAAVRTGWGLADAALFFYPITAVAADTLHRTQELLASPGLHSSLRRVLVDAGDELRCRLDARDRYGAW